MSTPSFISSLQSSDKPVTKTILDKNNQPVLHYGMLLHPPVENADLVTGYIEIDILDVKKILDIDLHNEIDTLINNFNLDMIVTDVPINHTEKIDYLTSCGFKQVDQLDNSVILAFSHFLTDDLDDELEDDLEHLF